MFELVRFSVVPTHRRVLLLLFLLLIAYCGRTALTISNVFILCQSLFFEQISYDLLRFRGAADRDAVDAGFPHRVVFPAGR